MAQTLAYILHTRAWRETSLLVDALTQDFGRVAFIAKGAKRPHSPLRGLLEPFTPVSIQFTGKLGIKNLTHAHWVQSLAVLHPAHSIQAWYLSELCLRSLGEDDPQPALYTAYDNAMRSLIALPPERDTQTILRHFEVRLLMALGLWPDASADATGQPLSVDPHYTLDEGAGWALCQPSKAAWSLTGAQIFKLTNASNTNADYTNAAEDKLSLQTVRIALRALLASALHGKVLSTREVWKELDTIQIKP
jgi:DNA repair protein RecO (recombination protein O)